MSDKRFNRVGGYVYDGEKCISHFEDVTHRDDIITLLNELHEDKEILEVQLKSANNEIDKLMSEINTLTDTCHDCCKEIREENEQLKQQLSDVRKENYGNLDGLNYYQEQNGHLSSKISDLECENEQLKSEINMLKITIGRNESYIARLTHKGEWKDTSKPLYRSINRGD